jgi:hypothetical protein
MVINDNSFDHTVPEYPIYTNTQVCVIKVTVLAFWHKIEYFIHGDWCVEYRKAEITTHNLFCKVPSIYKWKILESDD